MYDEKNSSGNIGYDYMRTHHRSVNYTAIILGVLSIVFSALNYFLVPFVHLVGITLGIIAIVNATKHNKSVLGLILGITGLALGTIALIIGIVGGILLALPA